MILMFGRGSAPGALAALALIVAAPCHAQSAPDPAAALERMAAARGIEETDAMNMIASQMPAELKRARADFVIENIGSLEDLEHDVDALWSSLQRDAAPLETAAQVS